MEVGGFDYSYTQAATDYAVCFAVLVAAVWVSRAWLRAEGDGRWFFVHAMGNAYIVYYSWWDVINTFVDPETALIRPADAPPISYKVVAMIGAIHGFHALFYKLSNADIFHHVAFVIFNQVAIMWPAVSDWKGSHGIQWGSSINALNFFVCGLPGGLDYFFLALVKNDRLSRKRHKVWQAALNVWLRCPGTIATVTIIFFECRRHWNSVPASCHTICVLTVLLIGYNALHYMEAVVASAGKKVEEFRGTC